MGELLHLDVENDTQNSIRHEVPNRYICDMACVYGVYNGCPQSQGTGHVSENSAGSISELTMRFRIDDKL